MHNLCNVFPEYTLCNIQLVLKTGNGLLEERLRPHLEGVSAYLGDDLLIVSDVDLEIGDYVVIDVLSDLRPEFVRHDKQPGSYVIRKRLAGNDRLMSNSTSSQSGEQPSSSFCSRSRVRSRCGRRTNGMSSM
jgi:hypothetical protein